jgi:hypothetical protein
VTSEVEQLREATRAAHEMLQDLRAERRVVETLIRDLPIHIRDVVAARIEVAVVKNLAVLGIATEKAMGEAVDKVNREFDKLAGILLGLKSDDRPSLEVLIGAYHRTLRDGGR